MKPPKLNYQHEYSSCEISSRWSNCEEYMHQLPNKWQQAGDHEFRLLIVDDIWQRMKGGEIQGRKYEHERFRSDRDVFLRGDELEKLECMFFSLREMKTTQAQDLSESQVVDTKQSVKERNKMLAVILAMAKDKYDYKPDSNRNVATGEGRGSISAAMDKIGLSVDPQTVREYLKEAYEIHRDSINS